MLTTETENGRYTRYLPALFQEDSLLRGFLGPFEDILQSFDQLIADLDRYFTPAATDADFLPWLATWVALLLDEEWDETKRRELIGEAVALYRKRGTVEGLQRYLEIYTGFRPNIREWCWPGGMQIGVASRIGGPAPGTTGLPDRIPVPKDTNTPAGDTFQTTISGVELEREANDYYVVTKEPDKQQKWKLRYYRADEVAAVTRGKDGDDKTFVEITNLAGQTERFSPASISRLDGIVDSLYTLALGIHTSDDNGSIDYRYSGNTVLIDEVREQPWRFILEVRIPPDTVMDQRQIEKIKAIVDLEKPAHTLYYLKITPAADSYELKPMQIGIEGRCEIGVYSIIG